MRYAFILLCGCVSFEHFTKPSIELMGINQDATEAGPTSLTATAGDQSVLLAWQAVPNASGYVVYFATQAMSTPTRLDAPGTSFLHTNLQNGTEYVYVVTAILAAGESAPSPEARATPSGDAPPLAPPAVPEGLQATAGNAQVTLSWTSVSGVTYRLLWGTSTTLDQTIDGVLSPFTHSALGNDTTYHYALVAQNAVGNSAPSAEVTARPSAPPPAPVASVTALSFTPPNANSVVTWTATPRATKYRVYWQTTPGVSPATATMIETAQLLADVPVPACTTTLYARVAGVGPGGEGPLSVEVSGRYCPGGCTRPVDFPNPTVIVNPSVGDDASTQPGCFPFATLARGLTGRSHGDVVYVAGNVTATDLTVSAGVTVVGDVAAPQATTITGTSVTNYALRLLTQSRIMGLRVTAPGKNAVQVAGTNATIDRVHVDSSSNGVLLIDGANTGTTINSLTATANGSGVVTSWASSDPSSATITNSVLKNNTSVGLYIDSYGGNANFTLTNTTIACNAVQDIHTFSSSGNIDGVTIAFTISGATFDTPYRVEDRIYTGPSTPACTAGVELCAIDGSTNGTTVLFNGSAPSGYVPANSATCP